ncbi:MAG: hypothetical protein K2H60_03000 [Muribaculaceae bacterium]|nr:hypothetical protein [Muribaculaceae bacterium]
MDIDNFFKEYTQSFNNLYWYSPLGEDIAIPNEKTLSLLEEIDRIMHGDLCRYTKDLLDALICFRNRFEDGKRYILRDIDELQHIVRIMEIDGIDPRINEEINCLVSKLKSSYENVCRFVQFLNFYSV